MPYFISFYGFWIFCRRKVTTLFHFAVFAAVRQSVTVMDSQKNSFLVLIVATVVSRPSSEFFNNFGWMADIQSSRNYAESLKFG